MALSQFSMMMLNGKHDEVRRLIRGFPTLVSTNVSTTGQRAKVVGTVLHIAKAKKVTFTAKAADKRTKREKAYFRMVFCRENGCSGGVFVVMFQLEDKVNFRNSLFEIGTGTAVINPLAIGEWGGSVIITSASPCLTWIVNESQYIPSPFPEIGFIAFYFESVHLTTIDICILTTCPGRVCGGLYGLGSCPCVETSKIPITGLSVYLIMEKEKQDLCELYSLKLEPYTSTKLTEILVVPKLLENHVKHNNQTEIFKIFEHTERQLRECTWNVAGWVKAKSSDDAVMVVPRAHVISIIPTGPKIPKQFGAAAVANIVQNSTHS